jgi:hypothetical protein
MIRVCESRCPKCGQSVREERAHYRCERCGVIESHCESRADTIDDTKAREAVESLRLASKLVRS